MGPRTRSPESPPRLREVARAQSRPGPLPLTLSAPGPAALAPPRCRLFRQLGRFLLFSPSTAPGSLPQSTSPSPPLRGPAGCRPVRASRPRPAGACGCLPTALGALVSVLLPLPPALPRLCPSALLPDSPGLSASRLRPPPGPARPPAAEAPPVLSPPSCAVGAGSRALLPALPALSARCHLSRPGLAHYPSSPPFPFPGARGPESCRRGRAVESPAWGVGPWSPLPPPVRCGSGAQVTLTSQGPFVRTLLLRREKEGKSEGLEGSLCPRVRSGPWTDQVPRSPLESIPRGREKLVLFGMCRPCAPSPSQCAWALS